MISQKEFIKALENNNEEACLKAIDNKYRYIGHITDKYFKRTPLIEACMYGQKNIAIEIVKFR